MKIADLVCPNCGAEFKNVDRSKLICPYCGSVLLHKRIPYRKKQQTMRK